MIKKILGGLAVLLVLAVAVLGILLFRPALDKQDLAKYAGPQSQFLELPDGAVAHYRDQGNKNGKILVLVHGSNASLHTWEPWVEELGDTFRLITVDMPGHGLTGAIPSDDYSRASMAHFLDAVMRELGLTGFALGGNSMGGGIAAHYTIAYPEKVSHLILVSSGGFPASPDREVPLAFRMASTPIVKDLMPYMGSRAMVEDGLKNVIVDDTLVTEEMIDRYSDLNRYKGNREAMVQRFGLYGMKDDVLPARLGEIDVPTLILWGEKDYLIPVENAHKFNEAITGSTLVIYENAGHIAMEEVPEKSAADVRAFLEKQ